MTFQKKVKAGLVCFVTAFLLPFCPVVTLLSNWRAKRGALYHDGIVPSHAVGYLCSLSSNDEAKILQFPDTTKFQRV